MDIAVMEIYSDGFANLVNKYGLIPVSAMPETYQSQNSGDLNDIITHYLNGCVNWIYNNRDTCTLDELQKQKKKVLHQIYDILVKFLGQPPQNFTWFFTRHNEDGEHETHSMELTTADFTNLVIPKPMLDIRDFVVLSHFPTESCKFNKLYEVNMTSNMVDGKNARFINVSMPILKKFALKSLLKRSTDIARATRPTGSLRMMRCK